ncbi:MAG TPA: glycosyl hydrolase 53 family protein, partial [Jatrophihabitans sp.]|nr:glycosyl hydrolase 53 family protein [Jatrophihabitans sp.]
MSLPARAALATVAVLVVGVLSASTGSAQPAGGAAGLAVNLALSGASASATSAADGKPASAAIDGSASTAWCATQWSGTLTVDLGAPRTVTGLGVTAAAGAFSANASVELASTAGNWHAVPSARNIVLEGNTPSYISLDGPQTVRYARLTASTGDGSPACIGEFRLFGHSAQTNDMMLGADLSFGPQELAAGTKFTDQGRTATPVQILRAHGGNYVRMRLWVNPPAGYSDLASDLALARRVAAAGMRIYLDIHYSDFWADPQHEDTPAAWQGQDLATLADTVRQYTRDVIAAFAKQGTPVSMVSIGNEIRNGFLWPTGQLDWTANTGWDNLATLLKAGVAGAHNGNPPGHPLRIMLHFDQGGDNADSYTFFHNLVERGVQFDVIGLSYYPFWHGPVTALRDNVDKLATQFGKDIVVAETQYAWTLANGDTTGNFVWQASQLEPGYPASAGGQLSLANDVLSILAQVPGGH